MNQGNRIAINGGVVFQATLYHQHLQVAVDLPSWGEWRKLMVHG